MSSTERELVLRKADPGDASAVAEVYLTARRAAIPAMPPLVHDDHDVRRWIESRLRSHDDIWVAELDGTLVAYVRNTPGWLDDLYVAPAHVGQGIGSALLDLVKSLQRHGFGLWVFETNEGARRFYRRHGLLEVEHTDGSGNEERCPDVRMAWPGRGSKPLRGRH